MSYTYNPLTGEFNISGAVGPTGPAGDITTTSIAGLTSEALGSITSTAFLGLTSGQLGAITTTAITGHTSTQMAALTTTALAGLTSGQRSALLASTTLAGFMPATGTPTGAYLKDDLTWGTPAGGGGGGDLTTTQMANLTTTVVAALSTTAMSGFTTTQINTLSTTQLSGLSSKLSGSFSIFVPASAMVPRTTNGAAAGAAETSTNKVMLSTLDFDAATIEYAQFAVQMPDNWDGGSVTADFVWSHASTTTNFGVVWGIQGVAFVDDDASDTAFGTAQTVADTGGTTDDIYKTSSTSAITLANTPTAGDWVVFQVYRSVADGSDTMTADARLHGVNIEYGVSSYTVV